VSVGHLQTLRCAIVLVAAASLTAIPALGSALPCSGWQTVPSVTGNIRLSAVAALSDSDVWASGHIAEAGLRAVFEHWDGSTWSRVPEPPTRTWHGINDLAAVGPSDVWAVGWASVNPQDLDPFRPFAEHWDGTEWTNMPVPRPLGASSSVLTGVSPSGPHDLLAVGYRIVAGERRTLAERWHRGEWTVVPSENPSVSNGLLDVSSSRPSSGLTVGYRSDGSGYRTLIERWNGDLWSNVRSANPADIDNVLTSIASVPDGGRWAVGYRIQSGGTDAYRSLIESRSRGWVPVPSANAAGTFNILDGVSFSSPSDGWAVGARLSPSLAGYRPLIQHWDGSDWSLVRPASPAVGVRLRDVTGVPGSSEAWAVGSVGINGLIERFCGGDPPVTEPSHHPRAPSTISGKSADGTSRPEPAHVPADASQTPIPTSAAAGSVSATDEAADAGLGLSIRSYGAAVADSNGDAFPDVAISGAKDPAHLFLNNGAAGFIEPDPQMFPHLYRLACSWGDANADGRPDLFCATSADSGTDFKSNELWIQQPDGSFRNEAVAYGVADPLARGRRGVFVDVNGDGYQDLWVGNDNERPDGLPSSNRLFLNQGGKGFVDDPSYGLDDDSGPGVGPWLDVVGDESPELVSASRRFRLLSNGGDTGYADIAATVGLPSKLRAVCVSDVNGDGMSDLVGLANDSLQSFIQTSAGHFSAAFSRSGFTHPVDVAAGDVNGDGLDDLYVVQGSSQGANAPDHMLLNGGEGTSFSRIPVPETTEGAGDEAVPLDFDANGLTDFLVLNGRPWPNRGPVQLIAFHHAEPS
jgi:hypothetical protein